jgi:DNA-binding transcriptional LysR family regulator
MEIRELRAFTAVAEEGSFSAAARKLHLSQSALSQTIRSLERHLGVRLLERHPVGVTTTDAGSILLREARALLAQHDQALAAVTGQAAPGPATLRVGVPLELPGNLLPRALAEMSATFPHTRAEISHASSAAQLTALEAGHLDLALARECPAGPGYDAVLAAEEPLGVLLGAGLAAERAGPGGVWLHQLADLEWTGFSRTEAPAWHDQVTATLRSHGISIRDHPGQGGQGGLIAEVKLAAAGTAKVFALAPPGWSTMLPDSVTWCPLTGSPLVRRTWAVWPAATRRRDLAAFVAALDITMPRPPGNDGNPDT